jgi:hypothetical protein
MSHDNESMNTQDGAPSPVEPSVNSVDRGAGTKHALVGGDLLKVLALTALLGLVIGVIVLIELRS